MYIKAVCVHVQCILYMYLVVVAEQEGIPAEGKAVPHSPGGSSLEGEGNHTHPAVHPSVCVCMCASVCVCVCVCVCVRVCVCV